MIFFHGENQEAQKKQYDAWLRQLKPGDMVAYDAGRFGGYSLMEISRMTPTTLIINGYAAAIKFDRKTGKGKGGNMRYRHIEPVTHQIVRTLKRTKLVSDLSQLNLQEFSLDTLQRINRLVQKERKRIHARAKQTDKP